MVRVNREPGEGAIPTGDDHYFLKAMYNDEWVGIHEWHKDAAGEWCVGYVPFNGTELDNRNGWDVQSLEPLTISPSLLCMSCGSHGFIRNGAWERA